MLRLGRRGWVVVGAPFVAVSITMACGDALPESSEPALPDGATPSSETGTPGDGPSSVDAADAGTDSPVDAKKQGADGSCTTDDPYGDAAPLEDFGGLGDVTSVRPSRDGTSVYLSHDQGTSTWYDLGEHDWPLPPSPLPASIRDTNAAEENPIAVADDTRVFWDQPIDGGAKRIFSALRAGKGQNIEDMNVEEEPVPRYGKTQALTPWLVGGKEVLYYAARDATNGTAGIYRATRSGSSWTGTTEYDPTFDQTHPVVTDDEKVMYFAQKVAAGRRQVFYVTRPLAGGQWSAALPVEGDVNWPDSDNQPTWISPDQCTLVFTSNRVGSTFKPYKIVRVRQ